MSTALQTLTTKLSKSLDMGNNGSELIQTLKSTAFRGDVEVTDAQMTALMVVANQYKLNPWTKEIYAFADQHRGIVPVVGVDGWSRIINEHPQFDGIEFEQDDEKCTCIIFRKDRSHPTKVTEYISECRRNTGPWKSHPKRMLRHKALIQAARIAFGYTGIYDQDEAEAIVDMGDAEVIRDEPPPPLPECPADYFKQHYPEWRDGVQAGKFTPERIINAVSLKYTLTDKQLGMIRELDQVRPQQEGPAHVGEFIPADPGQGQSNPSDMPPELQDWVDGMEGK